MSCPKSEIERNAYVRKAHSRKSHSRKAYTKANGTKVHATYVKGSYVDKTKVPKSCVPDKGRPGKTPESDKVLPKPGNELHLSKFGYSTDLSREERRNALIKASKNSDELKVLKRLNLLRNIQPCDAKAKKRMSEDVEFMKGEYIKYKQRHSRGNSRKTSKKSMSKKATSKKSVSKKSTLKKTASKKTSKKTASKKTSKRQSKKISGKTNK